MFKVPEYIQGTSGGKNNHLIFQNGKSRLGSVISINWNEFAYNMQMSCHKTVTDKLNAELFSPWSPKENLTGRTKDCVESTALIVFDLDKIETIDLETVSSWCLPYANFIHTTFSHGIDGKGCFRIYIPLEQPIPIELYQSIHQQVLSSLPQIKDRIDSSSSDISRCFFLPSCPPETKKLAGYTMNLLGIHAPIMSSIQSIVNAAPLNKKQHSSIVSPPPSSEGSRNKDLASYAGKAYAKGLNPDTFIDEAIRWGSECTPALDLDEVRSVVNSMWQTHLRNNPTQQVSNKPKLGKYLRSAEELKSDPPLEWAVRGVLPSNGIGAIYGAPSSGKTFLALDLAFAVAMGESWFTNPALQKPVAYIALEGSHGIRQRIQAWEKANSISVPKNLLFVTSNVSIDDEGSWQDLTNEIQQTLGNGAIVFIDTLNRASPTADENASASMGKIIDSAKRMSDQINGFVMFVHHAGKDASRGLRGHSSLLAALDTVIKVTTGHNQRIWAIEKSKDSEIGICRAFDLQVVDLDSRDSWGITHTSCVVRQGLLAPPVKKSKRGIHQQKVMDVIATHMLTNPKEAITLKELESKVADALDIKDAKRKMERAKTAIQGLINSGDLINTNRRITTA
jgi:KaiC/GvpD/RAD55 family RecA-like ATPase